MLLCGSRASAAVIPISSSPPKENMITARDIISPFQPVARKPPCFHRLSMFARSPPCPEKSSHRPKPIMPIIASTLISANQNSVSPYRRTFTRFTALIIMKKAAAQIHVGTSGSQYCM
ncbi:hypothetical protein D3C72_1762500 [compost metagenome]